MELAHKPVLISNVARSVVLSTCWNIMLQWQGASVKTWRGHKTNKANRWIAQVLPILFGTISLRTEESLAPAGFTYSNLMAFMFGIRPTTVTWEFDTGVIRPVTVFDRLCFSPNLASVYDTEGNEYEGYVPVTLGDAWIQLTAKCLPMGWTAFPSPDRFGAPMAIPKDSKDYYWHFQVDIDVNGALQQWQGSLERGGQDEYWPANNIERQVGPERWNARMFLTDLRELPRIVGFRGDTAEGTVEDGRLPWIRINFLIGDEAHPIESLGQSTLCVPHYDSKSRRLHVVLPIEEASAVTMSWAGQGWANRAVFMTYYTTIGETRLWETKTVDSFADRVRSVTSGFRIAKLVDEVSTTGGAQTPQPDAEQVSLTESTAQ
nr:MAG: capsid protein [Hameenlinna toti-like virus]